MEDRKSKLESHIPEIDAASLRFQPGFRNPKFKTDSDTRALKAEKLETGN